MGIIEYGLENFFDISADYSKKYLDIYNEKYDRLFITYGYTKYGQSIENRFYKKGTSILHNKEDKYPAIIKKTGRFITYEAYCEDGKFLYELFMNHLHQIEFSIQLKFFVMKTEQWLKK